VYPIYAVEVFAKDITEAKRLALEAMMGCHLDDIDEELIKQSLEDLSVDWR
jgi:hypothetical protein